MHCLVILEVASYNCFTVIAKPAESQTNQLKAEFY